MKKDAGQRGASDRRREGGLYPGGQALRVAPKIALYRFLTDPVLTSMPKASARPPTAVEPGADIGSSPALPATYEAAMTELEQLVGRLESGDMPLDQLLAGYQRGAQLLQHCREKLQAVEDQIKVLDEGTLKAWKPQ